MNSLARSLANLPFVGRVVHIAAALYRLPELRGQVQVTVNAELSALRRSAHRRDGADAEARATIDRLLASASSASSEIIAVNSGLQESKVAAATALADLPVMKRRLDELVERMASSESLVPAAYELLYALSRRLDVEKVRVDTLGEQFPPLLDSMSLLNSRLDAEMAPFKLSFPIALREIKRSQVQLQRIHSAHETAIEACAASATSALAIARAALEAEIATMRGGLDDIRSRQATTDDAVIEVKGSFGAFATLRAEILKVEGSLRLVEGRVATTGDLSGELELLRDQLASSVAARETLERQVEVLKQQEIANVELRKTVEHLLKRVEFVRQETMFELRYGSTEHTASGSPSLQPRIVDNAKLEAARNSRGGIRLNLGSGHVALDGYLNVDRRDLPGIDVVADLACLPFNKGEVSEISSSHVLEHFPQEQLRRRLLPYWQELLKPGGRFRAIVPDIGAMIECYTQGKYSYDDMREVIYGGQDYDGDFHYNMFTPESLIQILETTGFSDVAVVDRARRNGMCLEFEIQATRD